MKTTKIILGVLSVLVVLAFTVSYAEEEKAYVPKGDEDLTATPESTVKILFIGTSLTYWNKGIYYHIEQLASSANPPLVIEADKVVLSAKPLEKMWKHSGAREMIGTGVYDVVVLQESILWTNVDTFTEFARKFDAEIKAAGADTVLFMTWNCGPSRSRMEQFVQTHGDIAKELGVDVAPFGLAWERAMEERPDLDLCDSDGVHPDIYGTYLATNVVYAAVFEESPIGLAYFPEGGMTEEEAAFLRRIAWETVQKYQTQ